MKFWFIQDGVSGLGLHNALQPNHDERTNINTVGCVVRGNHWMVIGCLMSEIALVCVCGELGVHFYIASVPELKCLLWHRELLLLPLLSQCFGKEE